MENENIIFKREQEAKVEGQISNEFENLKYLERKIKLNANNFRQNINRISWPFILRKQETVDSFNYINSFDDFFSTGSIHNSRTTNLNTIKNIFT
jgi:hypothetical protein